MERNFSGKGCATMDHGASRAASQGKGAMGGFFRLRKGTLCGITAVILLIAMLFSSALAEAISPLCGLEEHQHEDSCYDQQLICEEEEVAPQTWTETVMTCTFTPHQHSASCYNSTGELACGFSTGYYHQHSDECYTLNEDGKKTLVCSLTETKPSHNGSPYSHSASCYETYTVLSCELEESDGHQHGDDCYREVLKCELEESEGHQHTDSCYVEDLSCGQAESAGHQHDASCYEDRINCGFDESDGHVHTEGCFETQFICTSEESEGHQHDASCYVDQITCDIEVGAGAHTHTDACYQSVQVLNCNEEHEHTETCYNSVRGDLICELAESEGHVHDEGCHTQMLVCGIEQGAGAHYHSEDSCYGPVLTCTTPVGEGSHHHDASCHTDVLICGTAEGAGAHTHTADCYTKKLDCGLEAGAGAHTHSDACYGKEQTCGKEAGEGAHHHEESCYKEESKLTCAYKLVHVHKGDCRDADGYVTCGYTQILEHDHTGSCFETITHTEPGHEHTDACYEKVLTCELEEHTHTDECWPTEEPTEEPTVNAKPTAEPTAKPTTVTPKDPLFSYTEPIAVSATLDSRPYTVTVVFQPGSGIPADAVLEVVEIRSGDLYESFYDSTMDAIETEEENVELEDVFLLEIYLYSGGEDFAEDHPFEVSLTLNEEDALMDVQVVQLD